MLGARQYFGIRPSWLHEKQVRLRARCLGSVAVGLWLNLILLADGPAHERRAESRAYGMHMHTSVTSFQWIMGLLWQL